MSAPTDADRAKAAEVLGWSSADIACARQSDTNDAAVLDAIAAALAAEREAALAPVLALADELDAWRENALRHARSCPPTSTDAAKSYGRAAAYQRATDRIRTTLAAPLAGQHTTEDTREKD